MNNQVKNKSDFLNIIDSLIQSLKDNPSGWENNTLESYLEAIKAWTEDMDGYYANNNLEAPTNINWQVFSDILSAAKVYE
jgi:hypothetical protein